ncbi:MAG: methyltransferase domain-containing protein [Anaerolineae bacterium]|nr:methyltransferase domain-containing protein [Anaerolineae bacterium]
MIKTLVDMLVCPSCKSNTLELHIFGSTSPENGQDGVVKCTACNAWYPLEDDLLEYLTGDLAYHDDRAKFWTKYTTQLTMLGLSADRPTSQEVVQQLQTIQQKHFDWYAQNDQQTYSAYERRPFWRAADQLTFGGWYPQIQAGRWLLDIGCAQGRSTFKFMDLDIHIVGFDISKHLVRQAIQRYRAAKYAAEAVFFVADGTHLPFREEVFDYVLIYGVLHHLPEPAQTCREVSRVLKHGGSYFGSENNASFFRGIFELLQRLRPQWHEEAGPEALLSADWFNRAFSGTDVTISTETIVFLPPHLVNLMSEAAALQLVRWSNALGQAIPGLRDNGGLINVLGRKA